MNDKTFISFNINGIRAAFKKGLREWILSYNPDFIGLQETKAWREQLDLKIFKLNGYSLYLSHCIRKGYSGVGVYSRIPVQEISYDWMEIPEFDQEGRVIFLRFPYYVVLNVYFPNGVSRSERLLYKMKFYDRFLQKIKNLLDCGENVIVMGDINTAHRPLDLSRPKENMNKSGFLSEERAWIDDFLSLGMIDTFRHFFPEKTESYTWWDLKSAARLRNIGWRIDYIFVSKSMEKYLLSASILSEIQGSDHCPVELKIAGYEKNPNDF